MAAKTERRHRSPPIITRVEALKLAEVYPADVVAAAMQPIAAYDIPHELRASVERQGQSLLALATSLVHAGLDAKQVRSVIEQALTSYMDELVSTILVLGNRHEV